MNKCLHCGNLFEDGEEIIVEENLGECHGFSAIETRKGCPVCKMEYEEITPCKICGSYEHEADEEYCENCKTNIKKRFADFVDKNFTTEERELLNKLYEGEWI